MKPIPTVGQKLFSLNIGNAARHRKQELTPVTVSKVGRKYFSIVTPSGFEYDCRIDDWSEKTDYSANFALYESDKEWENEKEIDSICNQLEKCFRHGRNQNKLSIEKLRSIKAIAIG